MSEELCDRMETLLGSRPIPLERGEELGRSREGRPVRGFRFGGGDLRVSLLGGCHADEPVGPRLLRRLASYLEELRDDDPLLTRYEWWLIPHINPDGAKRNRSWQNDHAPSYDLAEYLASAVRELPGDDVEFGFPRDPGDDEARPENRAAYDWWRSADAPFGLHVSLHGMAFAAGPWFLVEAEWRDRVELLKARCRARTHELGYRLHDVEREGEKGFFRIEPGFCTRPDSRYMRDHFIARGDPETAGRFRPSSMETICSFGGDPLTLVSEMPLFITPGVGERLGPPDPEAQEWRSRIERWRQELAADGDGAAITREARRRGLKPMPVRDQMILQWTLICAGIQQVEEVRS
jgi:hypothetical protein